MNSKEIRNALKSRLAGMSPRPGTAWPNVTFAEGTLPRLEARTDGVDREGGTLKGHQIVREIGLFSVVVCVEQGQGEDAALDYADAIAALFPEGQRITFSGGRIVIVRPPAIRAGFPDDTSYRVPVVIRYEATQAV